MQRVTLLLFLFLTQLLFAQSKNVNLQKAMLLKKSFKSNNIVAFSSTTTYHIDVNGEKVSAKESEVVNLISLESNVNYYRFVHYNDNLELKKSGFSYYQNDKLLYSNKICGDSQIDGIFYSDDQVCQNSVNLTYEGTEITFKSETEYKDSRYLTSVYFHDSEPSVEREIKFIINPAVEIDLVEKNFDGFKIQKNETSENGLKVISYKIENLSEFKRESNTLGFLHNYPHIIVVTKSINTPNGKKNILSNTDDIYTWYTELASQVEVDKKLYAETVTNLMVDANTNQEKIRRIFYWVQENINYVAFEDGIAAFKPASPNNVFQNRYGDCKGMANLTKAMLKQIGLDARLTWIGTNKIPYNCDLPSLAVNNHMICVVYDADKMYILDATEKYVSLGFHADRIQGKEMLIENGQTYTRQYVPLELPTANTIKRSEELEIDGMRLKGKGVVTLMGEEKKNILYFTTNSRKDDQKALNLYIANNNYNNDDVVTITNQPVIDRDLPLEVKYDYSLNNKISSITNELYIDIDWVKSFTNADIKSDRTTNFYFGRKIRNITEKKLKIPANYKVSHLPESIQLEHKDVKMKISFTVNDNLILYSTYFEIASGIIAKEDFVEWNKLVKAIKETYDDQIILTRI